MTDTTNTDRQPSHPLGELCRCLKCGEWAVTVVTWGIDVRHAQCAVCGTDWLSELEEMEERFDH